MVYFCMSSFKQVFSLPVTSIILARIIYAVNWFNISSIFYLILNDFKQDVSMLGLVTSGFLIGIGLFQIPAGILSTKYDAKFMIFFGTMLLSISSLLSGLSSELYQMVILRFLVGVGMAFFFGPSVILISKYLGKGSEWARCWNFKFRSFIGWNYWNIWLDHHCGGYWLEDKSSNQWNFRNTQWIVLAIRSTDKKLCTLE